MERNIYKIGKELFITSDEEIKKEDWVLWLSQNKIIKCEDSSLRDRQDMVKKIIFTTDPDLIADGVQSIDDEFLEWFVKNPSCEFAHLGFTSIIGDLETKRTYKIIIPKQGQDYTALLKQVGTKQETLEEVAERFSKQFLNNGDNSEFEAQAALLGVQFGAKWQAERMYSEDEVVHIVQRLMYDVHCGGICEGDKIIDFKISPIKWFEQFKK